MDDLFADRSLSEQRLGRADIVPLAMGLPAHLIDCDLDEADLSGLDLSRWIFERCQLRHTDFTGAKLDGTRWQSCRGGFVQLTCADLREAELLACDFNNGVLRRAKLFGAKFERCKLTGADLTDASALDVQFVETLLVNARLPGFSFRKQVLTAVDFSQADLAKCDFRGTSFDGCSLRDATLDGGRFDGADLRGADIGGLRLVNAGLFRGATISREQAGQLLGELGLNVR
jgi:uncharacterized protein YjbI with pentapeptide repeats